MTTTETAPPTTETPESRNQLRTLQTVPADDPGVSHHYRRVLMAWETEVPQLNLPLLRKVFEHLTLHPEDHDQSNWMRRWHGPYDVAFDEHGVVTENLCGTQGCVAGWAVTFSEDYLILQTPEDVQLYPKDTRYNLQAGQVVAETEDLMWNVEGRKVLGLTIAESRYLFEGTRTHDEVLDTLATLVMAAKSALAYRP